MINFYLKCHKCGGIQFTVLAITTVLKEKVFNIVCTHCGYESTIETINNKHTARTAET